MSDETIRILVDSAGHAILGSYDATEGSNFLLTCPYGQTVEPVANIWHWTDTETNIPAGYETLQFSYAVTDWTYDEESGLANYRCVMSVDGDNILGDEFIIAGDTDWTLENW